MPVTLTRKQALALSSLIAQHQEQLEINIESELITGEDGATLDPLHDPEICRRLQRDRRRWKACEGFQAILAEAK